MATLSHIKISLTAVLRKAFRFFILLTLALLAAPRMWSLYSLGLALVAGLLIIISDPGNFRRLCRQNLMLILPPLLYFLVVLACSLLQEWDGSLVEIRLMFLLLPLFAFPAMKADPALAGRAIRLYLWSLSAVLLFLIVRSILVYTGLWVPAKAPVFHFTNRETIFFSENFSVIEHPTYLAMKVAFAMLIIVLVKDSLPRRGLRILLFLLFSLSLFLLGSKGGLLAWILIAHIAAWKIVAGLSYRLPLFGLLLIVLYAATGLWASKVDRIDFFLSTRLEAVRTKNSPWQELDQRTREWYAAMQLIREKPLAGHGLARVQGRLDREYGKHGWDEEAGMHLNAHNQFLENQAALGIAGSMVLVWLLLTPLLFRKKTVWPQLAVALSALMTFFLMFESMFNRQWGIMFFMLFYCILMFAPRGD